MKEQLILLAVIIFSISFKVCGQDSLISRYYELSYGTQPNMESAAESIISSSSLVFDLVNAPIEKMQNRPLRFLARLTNYSFLQLYAGGMLYGTVMHEQFGHFSRAREFRLPLELQYNFPGLGGDFLFPVDQKVPALQRQIVVGAGLEATSFLAYRAVQSMYENDYSGSYVGLYLLAGKLIEGALTSQMDISPFLEDANQYYSRNSRLSRNPTPNDPLAYILALTESYGYYDDFIDPESIWVQQFDDMTIYTQNEFIHDQNRRLKRAFLLSALDPALLSFLHGTFAYFVQGSTFIKPLMFRIKDVSFMPSIRANYGELGAENYFDLFLKIPNLPFLNVYYRSGGNMIHKLWGAGLEIKSFRINQLLLNCQLDYWKNERLDNNNFNILMKGRYSFDKNPFSISLALANKSEGLLMGKPYAKGFYGYIGMGVQLQYQKN